ncbi:MAG: GAF domain-containing protein [Chloroflexota bacterium]
MAPGAATAFAASAAGRRILRTALDEAARLLRADGGNVYLVVPETAARADGAGRRRRPGWVPGDLRNVVDAGLDASPGLQRLRSVRLKVGTGVFGLAVATGTVQHTGDYLADHAFEHLGSSDAVVADVGIRSLVVAPLRVDREVIGALGVFSTRPDAFAAPQRALIRALAEHAAVNIRSNLLIRELGAARRQLGRRIQVERTLREISAQLVALRDPASVLQRTVDAAAGLLDADGARIDLIDDRSGVLLWGYDASTGARPPLGPIEGDPDESDPDEGITGRAARLGRPVWTPDYLVDPRFKHAEALDAFARRNHIRSAMAAPIAGESAVLGTLTVYTARVDDYDAADGDLLAVLADQASLAITNARRIEELTRSRSEFAARAQLERGLRQITAGISAERDPQQVLHLIAREAARLTGCDRTYINVLNEPGAASPWVWYSPTERGVDPWSPEEGVQHDEGVTGRAISTGRTVITPDYLADERFIHRPATDRYMRETGMRSCIAVPIVDGETPLGALWVESPEVDAFDHADAELLEALARQAGIALSNARLLARLRESEAQLRASEARFRYLVNASPDVVWEVDLDGRFTFVSDAVERMTGRPAGEVVGRPMAEVITPDTLPAALDQFERLLAEPDEVVEARFALRHLDGHAVPLENFATGVLRNGRLVGGHGSGRDLSEREHLERDLGRQASELASSAERAHLARELHDSVTQALFAMTLVSRSIELQLPRDPDAARARFAELRDLQREALAEMRSLIFELRPGSIERDGLEQALRTHAAAVESRVGLPIELSAALDERLPLEVEETLYRIAQEALHNIVRHAGASRAWVSVERHGSVARLVVRDDGRGFDPGTIPEGHLGVAGMRARAERVGGSFRLTSVPGAGSSVTVELPVG